MPRRIHKATLCRKFLGCVRVGSRLGALDAIRQVAALMFLLSPVLLLGGAKPPEQALANPDHVTSVAQCLQRMGTRIEVRATERVDQDCIQACYVLGQQCSFKLKANTKPSPSFLTVPSTRL